MSVGQHNAVEVIDYFLRRELGEIIHADVISMTDAAWMHYKQRVGWWHRYVVQYVTVWAVVVALSMGVLSITLSLWRESAPPGDAVSETCAPANAPADGRMRRAEDQDAQALSRRTSTVPD